MGVRNVRNVFNVYNVNKEGGGYRLPLFLLGLFCGMSY